MSTVPTAAYGRGTTTRSAPAPRQVQTPTGPQTVYLDERPRCTGTHKGRPCGKLLAEFVARPWSILCSRCRTTNVRNAPPPAPS